MRLWQRFWRWYFWGTPPIPYGRRSDMLKQRLWNVCHSEWVREWRHALLVKRAMYEAAAYRSRMGIRDGD